ncbi:hypothetical protein, partial [Thiococcus pfennigii]|uniref:hypothetical protein n=1 Tax=Thiococcus pfennigii TaxID=1057 RepID=UPI001A91D9E1
DESNSHRPPVFLADGLDPNEKPPPGRHEASGFFEFNGVFFQAQMRGRCPASTSFHLILPPQRELRRSHARDVLQNSELPVRGRRPRHFEALKRLKMK